MSAGTVAAWVGGVVGAFLLGSVNPATIIARILGKDLAASGSGNRCDQCGPRPRP